MIVTRIKYFKIYTTVNYFASNHLDCAVVLTSHLSQTEAELGPLSCDQLEL